MSSQTPFSPQDPRTTDTDCPPPPPDPQLGDRLVRAVTLAVRLHSQQPRKGARSIPYLGHLLGVCGLVIDDGGSEDEAIAGLLHDAVEDQGGAATLELIRTEFDNNVAAIVDGCSDTDEDPKPPWLVRKRTYIERLGVASDSVLRVSVADKLNNMRAIVRDYREIGDALWSRFNPDADQVWYYGALLRIYTERFPGPMTEELQQTYNTLLELLARPKEPVT